MWISVASLLISLVGALSGIAAGLGTLRANSIAQRNHEALVSREEFETFRQDLSVAARTIETLRARLLRSGETTLLIETVAANFSQDFSTVSDAFDEAETALERTQRAEIFGSSWSAGFEAIRNRVENAFDAALNDLRPEAERRQAVLDALNSLDHASSHIQTRIAGQVSAHVFPLLGRRLRTPTA